MLVYLESFLACTVVALKAAEGTLAVGIQNIKNTLCVKAKQGDVAMLNLLRQVVESKTYKTSKIINSDGNGFSLGFACHAVALSGTGGYCKLPYELSDDPWGDLPSPRNAPLSCSCCRDGWLQSAAVEVKIENVSKKSQQMIDVPEIFLIMFLRFPPLPSSSIIIIIIIIINKMARDGRRLHHYFYGR